MVINSSEHDRRQCYNINLLFVTGSDTWLTFIMHGSNKNKLFC